MIHFHLVIPEQTRGDVRSTELSAAYRRAAQAYVAARRGVYDLHGGRLPPGDRLSTQQRELLDELASAEAALDLQRQREWRLADAGDVRTRRAPGED